MKKHNLRLFLRFGKFLLPYWKLEILIGTLSLLGVLLSLVYPYLTKLIIDQAFAERDLGLFLSYTVIGTAVLVGNGLVSKFTGYLNRYIRARVDFDITRQIFEKMQSLPFHFFLERSSGEHLFKIQYDIYRVVDLVVTMTPQALGLIPRFLFVFIIVFRLDARLSALCLLLAPMTFFVPCLFTNRLREKLKEHIQSSQKVFNRLAEVFSHAYLIRAFSSEKRELETYNRLMDENLRLKKKNIGLEVSSQFYASLAQRAVIGLVGVYGGWRVITGDITLGSLTAIMVYLTQLVTMQSNFATFFQDTVLNLVSCERLKPMLDAKLGAAGDKPSLKPEFTRHEIKFTDVHFSYDQKKPVLEKISFTLQPGSWGALVGPSGVGKTTVINLLLRLYDVKEGSITVDGHDIRDIEPEALKEGIGFVPQEPFLWNDTVRNNIRYSKEDATDREIFWAARMAHADEFVKRLPEKYETVIGENACKISEGQKQRIAIARALLKKPRILIFDEAFASVDQELEEAILTDIDRECPEATLLVVTHRSTTLKRMDVIYHLESPARINILHNEQARSRSRAGDEPCELVSHHPSQPTTGA